MKDSSEIKQAAMLFDQLISEAAVIAPPSSEEPSRRSGRPSSTPRRTGRPAKTRYKKQEPIESFDSEDMYRGDRLENMLFAMCKRGDFTGAVLVDSNGLPLAVYKSPIKDENLSSAFAMTLGDVIGKAGRVIGETDVDNISMDINYTDKACVRRFIINDLPYFLMIVCPQDIDERAEVEISIDQISSFLKKG